MIVATTNGLWWYIFKYNGQNIMNVHDKKVLDVYGAKDLEA